MSRIRISKLYKYSLYCYAIPFVFLTLAVLGIGKGLFLGSFFLGLLPSALGGIAFTVLGMRLSAQTNDREKKDIGYANLVLGLILSILGLFTLGFAYLATSS
jgi:hypothetical protein